MKFHIPFTKYDVHVSKRGLSYVRDGQLVGFTDWVNGGIFTPTTPIMEEIYNTVASEFAKLDLRHIIEKGDQYEVRDDALNYIISERPNPLQSKFEYLYTMMYQLWKYGNALAFMERDRNGNVIRIDPVNAIDYEFGGGYQIEEDLVYLKFKNKATNMLELVDYRNVIHLRANPNDIFYGDLFSTFDYNKVLINLVDYALGTLINELKDCGTVRGIIQIGGAATGYARGVATRVMAGQEEKISKQEEIIERIKQTKGGVLVLDAGEEWKSLGNPFSTTSTSDINKYIDMLLQFNGINAKVVNGTATSDAMEVFFYKTIAPRIEQYVSEATYKIFSKSAITRGHKIVYYRNPFEYVPTNVAIDIAYKGAMDTTTNERRRMIYKLPPIEGGDILMSNKNFENVVNSFEPTKNDSAVEDEEDITDDEEKTTGYIKQSTVTKTV